MSAHNISFARDTYTFHFAGPPAAFLGAFRTYYGPTMNAFEAAKKSGRAADLLAELQTVFEAHNQSSSPDATSILATFLPVAAKV